MNRAILTAATFACAVLGWWLPALWQVESPRNASLVLPPPRAEPAMSAVQSLAARVRHAGSAMAQFQAVADAVQGRGASLAFLKGGITGLTCEEAEELAATLAGEEVGRSATDGEALLRSLKDVNFETSNAALAAWAEENPDAALRTLFSPLGEGFSGYGRVLQRLAERDPAKTLEILRAAPGSGTLQNGWRVVLAACAEKGPDFALAALQSAPDFAKPAGVNAILSVLARTDPQAALTWRDALPADLRGRSNSTAVFRVWANSDPAAALLQWQAAESVSFEGESEYYFGKWVKADPGAAFRWMEQNHSEITGNSIYSSLRSLAGSDPQRALALLEGMDLKHRGTAIAGIARNWPVSDFPAAFTWARGLADDGERDDALENLALSARQLPEAERGVYIEAVGATTPAGFGILLDLDQPAALKSFATLPAEQQSELWKRVSGDMARDSPADAAQFLQHMLPENGGDAANAGNVAREHGELASAWAYRDPAAAATWVEKLPPGDAQKWAALNLVANWSRHDPAAAAAWTRRLPQGPARDEAEKQLAANAVAKP